MPLGEIPPSGAGASEDFQAGPPGAVQEEYSHMWDWWGLHKAPQKLLKQRAPPALWACCPPSSAGSRPPFHAGNSPKLCQSFCSWNSGWEQARVSNPPKLQNEEGLGKLRQQLRGRGAIGEQGFGERRMTCRAGGCSLREICPWSPPLLSQPIPGELSCSLAPLMTTIKTIPANEVALKEPNKTGNTPRLLSADVKRLFTPAAASPAVSGERPLARRQDPGTVTAPWLPKATPSSHGTPLGPIPVFPRSP